ncbi:alpha/beta fold hydrolase [Sphingobium chlorophenolicum]|uniref:alpha/beta fold hydrolase n=1 Tax=Sphingobium chlorophenolicum TaxID=46429 RepID=UPI00142EF743|nr:alpha/beta hydrolase [Sphingobium chlorophenolicum]
MLSCWHGGGQSRSCWRKAMHRLGDAGYRACTFDLRGHGQSEWSANGDYRIERFVEDLVNVVETFSRPAVLIGASFGGHVSLLTAARHPALVQALVLCDVTPWIEGEATRAMRQVMLSAAAGFGSVADAARHLTLIGAIPVNLDCARLKRHLRVGRGGRFFWHWDPRFFSGQEDESAELTAQLVSAAQNVPAPTLLIRAECSEIVTQQQLRDFRAVVPHAGIAELSGARHTVTLDDNDGYAEIILGFLDRCERNDSSTPTAE